MWDLDHKEGWALKNWCFQIVVLEKTFESPLDSKEIKPVNPKRNQPWIFIGRIDAEALILWLPDEKSQLIGRTDSDTWTPDEKKKFVGKDPDAEKYRWQEKKGVTDNDMVGWHH